jgi:hypothetical protein
MVAAVLLLSYCCRHPCCWGAVFLGVVVEREDVEMGYEKGLSEGLRRY